MHRIADHLHLIILIKQESLKCNILRKSVQLVQSAVPIDADRTVEVVAFQDVPQLTVSFDWKTKMNEMLPFVAESTWAINSFHFGSCNLQLMQPVEST